MYESTGKTRGRLTIAHVMSYYIPGLGYQENFLPFEQAALNNDVHIITGNRLAPHPSYETVYEPTLGPRILKPGTLSEQGVTIHRMPVRFELERHNNPWIKGCNFLLENLAPDIVHLHGVTPWTSLQVMMSPAARQLRLICDHHLCHFNMLPFTTAKRVYYAGFRLLCAPMVQRRVKWWLPINEDAQEVLGAVLGINRKNMTINRLGVDTKRFQYDPASGVQWRRAHHIPLDTSIIVHAGRLEPRKKIEDLLAAFTQLVAADGKSSVKLLLVGDGNPQYIEMLKALAASLNITDHTQFFPMQPHEVLPSLFNAADIGVWPGDVAVTMIEAMGCGLPVVLPARPGLAYVAHCPGAYILDEEDTKGLTKILTHLSSKKPDRKEIAQICAKRLSWKSIATQSLEIYHDVITQTETLHAG